MFTFSRDNTKDIENYYYETIVKFEETGDRLWKIDNITPSEITCVDADGFILYLDLDEPYDVTYALPGRVVYQYGGQAAILHRRPQKMYKRGLSDQNCALARLTASGKWMQEFITLQKLQQFVDKPAYQNPTLGIDPAYESIAINRYLSVTKKGDLYILLQHIGTVFFEEKKVILTTNLFIPEVRKAFPEWKVV